MPADRKPPSRPNAEAAPGKTTGAAGSLTVESPRPRRNVLSTHLIRLTARAAKRHYERLQARAYGEHEGQALAECAHLGLLENDLVRVRKAVHERAKWVVYATPA